MTAPQGRVPAFRTRFFGACSSRRALRRPARSSALRAILEALEDRACPSVFYDFNVIAQTGQNNLVSIEQGASINDQGKVAFVASESGGQGVYVGDGTSGPQLVSLATTAIRTYGREIQINNSDQVAAVDIVSGLRRARIWDANTIIGRSNVTPSNPADFNGLGNYASINNGGKLTFAGLNDTVWEVHSSDTLVEPGDFSTEIAAFSNTAVFRPMAADGGEVVIGMRQSGIKRILLGTTSDLTVLETTAAGDWNDLGLRPGISDDGQIVTFYGDLSVSGATALGTTPGPGIFASIETTGNRILRRIAGISGNGQLDPGETFTDANRNGVFDAGDTDIGPFASFDVDSRVGVNATQAAQRGVTIAYVASDSAGKAIYTNRLNSFGNGNAAFDPMDPNNTFSVTRPTPVVQTGEMISGLGQVTDLAINDPVNSRDRGDVAFWVAAGSTQGVVEARPRQVIFLDFDPVQNFSKSVDLRALALFNQTLNVTNLGWAGDIASVFSILAPDRADLHGVANIDAIKQGVIDAVQSAFDSVQASVQVVGTDPGVGEYMRIFLGDGSGLGGSNQTLNGIASAIDLFNQDFLTDSNNAIGSTNFQPAPDIAAIYVDNEFRQSTGNFTDGHGNAVSLNQTSGPGMITRAQVITAIANTVIHEAGHNLGLLHLLDNLSTLLMNAFTGKDPLLGLDELRSPEMFSATSQPIAVTKDALTPSVIVQNDQEQLRFATGSTDTTLSRPFASPPANIIGFIGRDVFSMKGTLSNPLSVVDAVLGIIPLGDEDSLPELIDLGGGDLRGLLDSLTINVGPSDQVFLIGSTDGSKIDVASTFHGNALDPEQINLTSMLGVLSEPAIRGDLFDSVGQPLKVALDLFQVTAQGAVPIGTIGSPDAPANNAPTARDDLARTGQGQAVIINELANDHDPDGSLATTSVRIVTQPANGTVVINSDGTITYTPAMAFTGGDFTTYQVADDEGLYSNTATVLISVQPTLNTPPVADDDSATTIEGMPVDINVIANDSDPDGAIDPTTVVIASGPAHGVAVVNPTTGQVTYAPNAGFVGADSLTYTVKDNAGAVSKSATISIEVLQPLAVELTVVNDGEAQRSMVTSQTITFARLVDIDDGAFEVDRQSGGSVVLNAAVSDVGGKTQVVLTYVGADVVAGSLADGNYVLVIHGDKAHDRSTGTDLDGDANGTPGGDRVDAFFRLFGDTDGDRDVDNLDYFRMRAAVGKRAGDAGYIAFLDFNGDGIIDVATDVAQFNQRRGKRLTP